MGRMARGDASLRVFGQRLRALRQERDWTQEELARRTGRHWTYIGGVERGERNPTLLVIAELAAALAVSVAGLLQGEHPLTRALNAPSLDILEAIQRGFRAQIDVKGKLAELYMHRRLEELRAGGTIQDLVWNDVDGKPDFVVHYRGHELLLECKNIRNEVFKSPPAYKVELQRTRNSMDGTPTRGYRGDEFHVLGVSLFNQTGRWEYLYTATRRLARRPTSPDHLVIMQRVPMTPESPWTADPVPALDDAMGDA
jgi:transcriptional regulator with XRE-family HTH domain